MEKVEIKKVTLNDADFLFRLMNDSAILKRLNEVPTEKETWLDAIQAWENDDDEEDYILLSGGKQIGWFAFNGLRDKTAYLKMAVILPDYQHKGIGTRVLSKLLEMMWQKGYNSVMLYTNQDNVSAQKCYKKCGFKIIESLTDKMSDNTTAKRYKMEARPIN